MRLKATCTVILVNPPTHQGRRRSLPFSIAYQESLLTKAGLSVKVLDFQHAIGEGKIPFPGGFFAAARKMLGKQDAAIYLFQLSTCSAPWIFELMRHVKEIRPTACTVAAGAQVRALAKVIQERIPWVDILVNTAPEEIIVELIESILSSGRTRLDNVPGISFRTATGQWQTTRSPVLSTSLDGLPWASLDIGRISPEDVISLEVARGCPQGCSFCAGKAAGGTIVRSKSPRRIVEEAVSLHCQMTETMSPFIMFEAEDFARTAFLTELLAEKQRIGAEFIYGCYARIRCLDTDTLDLLAETGCKYVFLGVESGSPRILDMLKKGMKYGDAKRVVRALLDRGIIPLCSLIYGFPDETEAEWHNTIDYCASLAWAGAVVHLSPLRLEPGSKLAEQTGDHDRILLRDSEHYRDLAAAGIDPETVAPQIGFYLYTLRNADYEMNETYMLSSIFLRALEQMPLTLYLAVRLLVVKPSQLLAKLKALSTLVESGANVPFTQSVELFFGEATQQVSTHDWLRALVEHEFIRFRVSPISHVTTVRDAVPEQLYEQLRRAPGKLDNYPEWSCTV